MCDFNIKTVLINTIWLLSVDEKKNFNTDKNTIRSALKSEKMCRCTNSQALRLIIINFCVANANRADYSAQLTSYLSQFSIESIVVATNTMQTVWI